MDLHCGMNFAAIHQSVAMKSKTRLSIPVPCHQDWNAMTQNERGKFCAACSKTVVDFTQKSTSEIQQYFRKKRDSSVCGKFKQSQLDSLVIEVNEAVFLGHLSPTKIFFLALLLVMGTSLLSCETPTKKQKVTRVIVVDSVKTNSQQFDSVALQTPPKIVKPTDSIPIPPPPIVDLPTPAILTGEVVMVIGVVAQEAPQTERSIQQSLDTVSAINSSEIVSSFFKKKPAFGHDVLRNSTPLKNHHLSAKDSAEKP